MAENCGVDGVVQFLKSIECSKYTENFRNRKIDGSMLYAILFAPNSDTSNILKGLGVSDPVEVFRIQTKFRKYLREHFLLD